MIRFVNYSVDIKLNFLTFMNLYLLYEIDLYFVGLNLDKSSIALPQKIVPPFPEQSFNFPKWQNFVVEDDVMTIRELFLV